MKKLVPGIIVGTAALIATQLLHHEQPAAPAADGQRIDLTTDAPRGNAVVAPAEPSPALPDSTAVARKLARVAPLPVASNASEPDTQDWDAPCACAAAWYARNQEREEAARRAEVKDVYWAYETEQLLEQYFVAQPRVRSIRISAIDCRTSFCEIKATGPPDAWEAFEAVIEQASEEPWSTFGDTSRLSSASRDDGQKDYDALIERTSDSGAGGMAARLPSPEPGTDDEEDCNCATPEWQVRKAMRDVAARAAEPKDIDWAYGCRRRDRVGREVHSQAIAIDVWRKTGGA